MSSPLQGSVEERIMELNEQRKAGQQSGSGQDTGAGLRGRGKKRSRTQQEIAGSIALDRQNLRTAELELLFRVRH